MMRFAYADPPYLGRGEYYTAYHADAKIWDDPETHRKLIDRLCVDYPDGWAYSLSAASLYTLLPFCPPSARVCAWITASPRYAGNNAAIRKHFEPLIVMGGRSHAETGNRAADYIVTSPERTGEPRYAMVKGNLRSGATFVGRKPRAFTNWMLDLLGVRAGDLVDDLFPGSGAVGQVIAARIAGANEQSELFEEQSA